VEGKVLGELDPVEGLAEEYFLQGVIIDVEDFMVLVINEGIQLYDNPKISKLNRIAPNCLVVSTLSFKSMIWLKITFNNNKKCLT
jgi:hypothetical protein